MTECEICKVKVSKKVDKYSKENFNKVLCFDCQKKANVEDEVKIKEVGIPKEEVVKSTRKLDQTQLLIVRQCCVKASAQLCTRKDLDWKDYIKMVELMEAWVLR